MLFAIYVLVLFFVPAFAPPPPVTPNAPTNDVTDPIWMQGWSTLPPGSSRPPSPQPEVNPSDETQHIPPHPVDHLPPASAKKLPEVNPSQPKPADPPPSSASGGASKGNAQSGQVDSSQHKPADHPASAKKLPEVNPSQPKPADPPPSSASGGGSKGNAQSGQVDSSQKKPIWEEGWSKHPSEVGPSRSPSETPLPGSHQGQEYQERARPRLDIWRSSQTPSNPGNTAVTAPQKNVIQGHGQHQAEVGGRLPVIAPQPESSSLTPSHIPGSTTPPSRKSPALSGGVKLGLRAPATSGGVRLGTETPSTRTPSPYQGAHQHQPGSQVSTKSPSPHPHQGAPQRSRSQDRPGRK